MALLLVAGLLALAVRLQFQPLLSADNGVVDAATGLTRRSHLLRRLADDWQWLSLPSHLYVFAAVACFVKRGRLAGEPIAVMLIGWLLLNLAKPLVGRPRPVQALDALGGFSFPSGHAGSSAVVATTLIFVFGGRSVARPLAAALAIVTLLTGLDRVLLGVHYPSDVIAGWCFGAGVVALIYAVPPAIERRYPGILETLPYGPRSS
ncbi:phosphatase PAP2 family protein [Calidifontibacter terrae]